MIWRLYIISMAFIVFYLAASNPVKEKIPNKALTILFNNKGTNNSFKNMRA